MESLKASWTVTAGVVPGMVEQDLTKSWFYKGKDYEADKAAADANGGLLKKYAEMRDAACTYANQVMDPVSINWVRVDFMWY